MITQRSVEEFQTARALKQPLSDDFFLYREVGGVVETFNRFTGLWQPVRENKNTLFSSALGHYDGIEVVSAPDKD